MVGVNGQNWPITGYTRSWYTGMMSVLKTMLTGSTYPSFPSSPADFAQLFSMRFPHYLGAWNRLRVIRNSCKWHACWSNTSISQSTKALSMNFSHTFSNRMKLYKIKLHIQSASFSLQDFSVFTVIFLTVKNCILIYPDNARKKFGQTWETSRRLLQGQTFVSDSEKYDH